MSYDLMFQQALALHEAAGRMEEWKSRYEGMPFEKLLLKAEPEYRGFNLCRFFNGKYGGRCFYLDLNGGDMRALSAAAANLPAQERKKQC